MVAIVPDGYCDLLWIDGRLVVAGPDRTAAFPVIRPGATVIGARFGRLLEGAARHEEEPAREAAVIFAAADSGRAASGLLDRLGMSERQLRRRCHHHFGYGAKTLERIRRLQRFLDLCRRSETMPLARLALEAGFADQPHMTREVGELSTLTPAVILDQLSLRQRAD